MSKRINILNAAEALLAERGVYGLSMKLLAARANIAAGTIYCYFDNKEALLAELLMHLHQQASLKLFNNLQETQTTQQQYEILWKNAFDAVLKNPQRLIVIEMLLCMPCDESKKEKATCLEHELYSPLIKFYQRGIDNGQFHAWPISALLTLSFDSAITLAKKILREELKLDATLILQVRDASWLIIQK